MTRSMDIMLNASDKAVKGTKETGFTLVEFLICMAIFLLVTSAALAILSDIQRTAGYQTESYSVLHNTQIAMQTVERYIRQAGNDPFVTGFPGITIVNTAEVHIRSDLTGSDRGNPDKGDPDGDTDDSNENVIIRFNSQSRTLEVVPNGGSPQIIAGYISDLQFQYYDKDGVPTMVGSDVRKITVKISGSSPTPNPQTHQFFGVTLCSEIRVMT
jgi:prepilin-type N-terminal cleavage/methylation domain-containing protein